MVTSLKIEDCMNNKSISESLKVSKALRKIFEQKVNKYMVERTLCWMHDTYMYIVYMLKNGYRKVSALPLENFCSLCSREHNWMVFKPFIICLHLRIFAKKTSKKRLLLCFYTYTFPPFFLISTFSFHFTSFST